jgi:predicted nucleotidyltransferase
MIKAELSGRIVNVLMNFFKSGEVTSLVLYGSYAEDREKQYSDIDLLIIINTELSNWREKRRIEVSLRRDTASLCPLSPSVMTKEDFLSALESYNPLVLNVLTSGKILHDTGLFKTVREQFEKSENKNVVRMPEGYWKVAI